MPPGPEKQAPSDFSDWIGSSRSAGRDLITSRLVASFEATFGTSLFKGGEVPPGLHWCLCPPIAPADELGPDGHPRKGDFLPPVPLPRRMWAGGEVAWHAPLAIDDTVEKTSTIRDISWKAGKSGQLCFVSVEHSYNTERGTAITERQDIVYRAAATGPTVAQTETGAGVCSFDMQRRVAVDEITLFRYSALTFNAHRIHYDLPYARNEEFYPDLVVHGPLQATLLLNLAALHAGRHPLRFRYRGVAAAVGAQQLTLGLNARPAGAELTIVTDAGNVSMTAAASW